MSADYSDSEFDLKTLFETAGNVSNERLNALYHFSRTLVTSNTPGMLLQRVVRHVVEIVQVSFCNIYIYQPEMQLECQASYSVDQEEKDHIPGPQYLQRIFQRVIDRKTPVVIHNRQTSLSMDEGRALRFHQAASLCLVPMWVDDKPMGLFVLGNDCEDNNIPFHNGKVRLAKLIADQSASAIYRASLSDYVQYSHLEVVMALAKAIDAHDHYTGGHSKTLVNYAERMAEKLGCSAAEVQTIGLAALLHDIGKIGIPDEVLQKSGALNEKEWNLMRRHPEIGAEIVLSVSRLSQVAAIIRSHHEHYDGTGYPLGLKGKWILLGARILTVVDAYDAMTSGRVYRPGRTYEEAIEEIKKCAGTHFDPELVDVFLTILREDHTG